MNVPRRNRSMPVLIGIGLVLVGLLAGILSMLMVVDLRPAAPPIPTVVERVQLGSTEPLPPMLAPDSSGPAVMVEPTMLNHLFKEVAGRITPAVVYIQVEFSAAGELPRDWFRNFDEEAQRRFQGRMRQSVGSGVIISEQGYIVTNQHVVDGAMSIQVLLSDKRQFDAEIVGIDPATDLAVIQIDAPTTGRLPVAHLGNSDQVQVGEWVLAVGNPFRLNSTVTAGIVSALGRQVNIINDEFGIEDFIQTDAAINPGNSGGALVNLKGELVGINTAIATESGSYQGYGFAVPVNLVERIVHDLIAFGEVERGFLGVRIEPVTARTARQLELERVGGVRLSEVAPGGAAYQSGLRGGDIVLSIDGRPVDAPNELQSTVARHRPGETLDIEVVRRGTRYHFDVVLLGRDDPDYESWHGQLRREQADQEPSPSDLDVLEVTAWGLGLQNLIDRQRDGFDIDSGAYVAYVENGSVAEAAGLPRDVVITHIDDSEVTSAEEAEAALARAEKASVLFRVQGRDGLAAFYEIDVPVVE